MLVQCGVCSAQANGLSIFFSFKAHVWEQRRWNRWGPVTRVQGADKARTDTRSLSAVGAVACGSALCHTSRNFGKRSGVPEDPAKSVDPACERASVGARQTPTRKKIHPRSRSSPSRHRCQMWADVVWCHRYGDGTDDDGTHGAWWVGWQRGGGCTAQ